MSKQPYRRLLESPDNTGRDSNPTIPTRLVSKGQYLKNIGEKGVTYVAGSFFGLLGIPPFCFFLFCCYKCLSAGELSWGFLYLAMVSLILSVGAFCGCRSFFRSAQEIEPMAPITRRNTGHLPAAETLVRPSHFPTDPQAELLRAAPMGSETPPEELLRTTGKLE